MPGLKPFKPIADTQLGSRLTDDYEYWNRLHEHSVFQDPSTITSVAFMPAEPYYLAATSNMRLSVYDSSTGEAVSVNTRFKSNVCCGAFRRDGGLYGAGTFDGFLHIYNLASEAKSKQLIRLFRVHHAPVRSIAFVNFQPYIASATEEGLIALWDITNPKATSPVWHLEKAHSDSIRCATFTSQNDNFLITGSYDHTVKLWDTRQITKAPTEAIMTIDHGAPVEQIAVSHNDKFLYTAGGLTVKIWDLSCGGRFIHAIERHHKTVTTLSLACRGTRLVTGGLDRLMNVFSLDAGDFRLLYSKKLAAGILKLDVSPNDEAVAIAMDNLVSIYRRRILAPTAFSKSLAGAAEAPKTGTDGLIAKQVAAAAGLIQHAREVRIGAKKDPKTVIQTERGNKKAVAVELSAQRLYTEKLGPIDHFVEHHAYRQAIATMFKTKTIARKIVAALERIRVEGRLAVALAGHDTGIVLKIIQFLTVHLFNNAYFVTLYDATNVFISVYAEEALPEPVVQRLRALKRAVTNELRFQKLVAKVNGSLDLLIQMALARQRLERESDIDDVFGEVYISKVPFITDDGNGDDDSASETAAPVEAAAATAAPAPKKRKSRRSAV